MAFQSDFVYQNGKEIFPRIISATTHTLSVEDNGAYLKFTSNSAITITVPKWLGIGFNCVIEQGGTGKITLDADAGVTINSVDGNLSVLNSQFAVASLIEPEAEILTFFGQTEA